MLRLHAPARRCFMTPIPDLSVAADLLCAVSDRVVAERMAETRQLVAQADLPLIAEYTALITGAVNPGVHWQSSMPSTVAAMPRGLRRMPPASRERAIHVRDGWRCRYRGTRARAQGSARFFWNRFRTSSGAFMRGPGTEAARSTPRAWASTSARRTTMDSTPGTTPVIGMAVMRRLASPCLPHPVRFFRARFPTRRWRGGFMVACLGGAMWNSSPHPNIRTRSASTSTGTSSP